MFCVYFQSVAGKHNRHVFSDHYSGSCAYYRSVGSSGGRHLVKTETPVSETPPPIQSLTPTIEEAKHWQVSTASERSSMAPSSYRAQPSAAVTWNMDNTETDLDDSVFLGTSGDQVSTQQTTGVNSPELTSVQQGRPGITSTDGSRQVSSELPVAKQDSKDMFKSTSPFSMCSPPCGLFQAPAPAVPSSNEKGTPCSSESWSSSGMVLEPHMLTSSGGQRNWSMKSTSPDDDTPHLYR